MEEVRLLRDDADEVVSDANENSRTSTPPTRTRPRPSYSRAARYPTVVLPAPVSPTSAVFVPAGTVKDTSSSVHSPPSS